MLIVDGARLKTTSGVDISEYVSGHEFVMRSDGTAMVYARLFGVPQDLYFGSVDQISGPKRVIVALPDDVLIPTAPMVHLKPLCNSISITMGRGNRPSDDESPFGPLPAARRTYEIHIIANVISETAKVAHVSTQSSGVPDIVQSTPSQPTSPSEPDIGEPYFMDEDYFVALTPL